MNEEVLFHEALARPMGKERERYLDTACAGRADLRTAVEALLAAHADSGDFILGSAVAFADSAVDGARRSSDTANLNGTTDPENDSLLPARKSVPDEEIPERIGRYQIRRLLGRGGMGAVYLAHDPELDRLVALKVPKLSSPSAEDRFLREARVAAAVSHPNLCPVYDAGRADGVLYLAMAYIPGSTLTETVKKEGALSPARAAGLAATIANAMAEAHRHEIVHRDLKPSNILLGSKGEPIVTDFGLAMRGLETDEGNQATEFEPRLTQAGMLMGTPSYMPPEQACGDLEKLGPATDVYALGAILFELLTGGPPFRADTIAQLVRKIVAAPAPLASRVRPGVPAALDSVCAKALAKEPAERFSSMADFAAALGTATSSGRQGIKRRVAIAAAACFLMFAIVAGVFYVKTDHGTIEVRIKDPKAKVQISLDGDVLQLNNDGQITKVRAGQHELEVTGPDFQTYTRLFKVTRGATTLLEVELKPNPKPSESGPPDGLRLAAILARGRRLLDGERFAELGKVAEEALAIDPESPGALTLRATYSLMRDDLKAARTDADAALKSNPETFQALVVRDRVNQEEGKFDEAIADGTAAIRLAPKNPGPYVNRGRAYMAKKEYRQVVADSSKAIDLEYTGTTPRHNRASAYARLGEYEKALADYDILVQGGLQDAHVFRDRSGLNARLGKAEQAAADWAAAKKLNPNWTDDDQIVVPPPPKPPQRKALSADQAAEVNAALSAAEKAETQGTPREMLNAADKALAIDPTSATAYSWRVRALVEMGQWQKILSDSEKAMAFAPNNPWLYA